MPNITLVGNRFNIKPLEGSHIHWKNIFSSIGQLSTSSSDVNIHCRNKTILKSNQIVLASSSGLLRSVLEPVSSLVDFSYDLVCPDFQPKAMQKVLDLISNGSTILDPDLVPELKTILKTLQMFSLLRQVENFIVTHSSISFENSSNEESLFGDRSIPDSLREEEIAILPYVCADCNTSFLIKAALLKHKAKKHSRLQRTNKSNLHSVSQSSNGFDQHSGYNNSNGFNQHSLTPNLNGLNLPSVPQISSFNQHSLAQISNSLEEHSVIQISNGLNQYQVPIISNVFNEHLITNIVEESSQKKQNQSSVTTAQSPFIFNQSPEIQNFFKTADSSKTEGEKNASTQSISSQESSNEINIDSNEIGSNYHQEVYIDSDEIDLINIDSNNINSNEMDQTESRGILEFNQSSSKVNARSEIITKTSDVINNSLKSENETIIFEPVSINSHGIKYSITSSELEDEIQKLNDPTHADDHLETTFDDFEDDNAILTDTCDIEEDENEESMMATSDSVLSNRAEITDENPQDNKTTDKHRQNKQDVKTKKATNKTSTKAKQCQFCRSRFSNKYHYLRHLANRHFRQELIVLNQGQKSKCTFCLQVTSNRSELMGHLAIVHNSLNGIVPDAINAFSLSGNLKSTDNEICVKPTRKMKKTTKSGSCKCQICNLVMTSSHNLMMHNATKHFSDQLRKFYGKTNLECGICSRNFLIPQLTKRHLVFNHKVLKDICPIQISPKGKSLKKNSNETKIKPEKKNPIEKVSSNVEKKNIKSHYQCHECPNKYQIYSQLKKHFSLSHFRKELQLKYSSFGNQCPVCQKKLKTKDGLLVHMACTHDALKSFIPEKTSLEIMNGDDSKKGGETLEDSKTGDDLEMEEKEVVEDEETMKDPKTEKDLKRKAGLKSCLKCSKSFATNAHLKIHYSQSHFGKTLKKKFRNKENKCDFCPKKFSHQNGLNYHLVCTHDVLDML